MKYDVGSLVGENCITLEDGGKVYEVVFPELKISHQVELDFTGVAVFASPFFNAAIGRLLKDFTSDDLNRLLRVTGLNQDGKEVLTRVIENSKRYYSDDKTRKAHDEILGEPSEDA